MGPVNFIFEEKGKGTRGQKNRPLVPLFLPYFDKKPSLWYDKWDLQKICTV